ncbi:DNA glycosylase AlkZ-like family protein [Secundilactobacillus muriivasis]
MDQQKLKQLRLSHLGFGVTQDSKGALTRTIGIQAQQAREADLNLSLRTHTPIETLHNWYDEQPVVRSWAQRWTHQLLTLSDWQLVISARQTETLPKTYLLGHETLVTELAALIQNQLVTKPRLTKAEVVALLTPLIPTDVKPNNLIYAVLQTLVARGRLYFDARSTTQNYVVIANQLPLLPVETALPVLIQRYIEGFGPVSLADFCKWSGIRITQARPVWQQVTAKLSPVMVAGQELVAMSTEPTVDLPVCQLAARFDACFTGYADKNWLVTPEHQKTIWTKNGLIMAPILLRGVVIGHWQHRQLRNGVAVTVKHWQLLTQQDEHLIKNQLAKDLSNAVSQPLLQVSFESIS